MGEPEPIEPESESDAPAPSNDGRADWLCGPEEGIEAEHTRRQRERENNPLPKPTLFRPGSAEGTEAPQTPATAPRRPEDSGPMRAPLPISQAPPPPAKEPVEFASGMMTMAWERGMNSVPDIRREAPAAVPETTRDFPMDDAEERALASAEAAQAAATAAEQAARPHDVVSPEAFDIMAAPMPWWLQSAHLLRTDRRIQLLVVLVVAALVTVAMWPRGDRGVSVAEIKRHPSRYDSRGVIVQGRVGDVFKVGGSYAFYLLQGRDTLVVFTRSRTPSRDEHVKVQGQMSTGYLDGFARMALFEGQSN